MTTAFAFLLGMIPPFIGGWLTLALLQGKRRVLLRAEQGAAALVIGLHLHMLLAFVAHVYLGIPLTLSGFLGVQAAAILALGIAWRLAGTPGRTAPQPPP